MISLITLLALFGVWYAYFGYPLVLIALNKYRPRSTSLSANPIPNTLSIIVAARNEAGVIREKLENTLAVAGAASAGIRTQVIVASDCSDDGMDAIVQEFSSRGVQLVRSSERNGKEFAQKLAVESANGEIVLFTDAKVRLEEGMIPILLNYFSDPSVGAVSTTDRVEHDGSGGSGEGMYVRYEMWLRKLETEYQTVIGLSGSGFAVRRELTSNLRNDIPSDFALLIETRKRGLRGVSAPDLNCFYRAVRSEEEEFGRKVRTVLRGITTLFACREVMNPFSFGTFAWQIISHKLMRWLVPWFLLVATLGSIYRADQSLFFWLVSIALLLFYCAAFLAYIKPGARNSFAFKVPLFFMVTNLAIVFAWLRFWRGEKSVVWQPSAKPV